MMTQTLTLSKLSTSTWEASFQNVRQIYSAVIRSAWTYESAVWYHSKETCEMKNHIIKRMTVIQNQCLRKISGAYRVTLIEILEAETFIPSADLYLQKLVKIRTLCNTEDREQVIIKNACALIVRQLQSKCRRSHLIIETSAEEIKIWANQGAMNVRVRWINRGRRGSKYMNDISETKVLRDTEVDSLFVFKVTAE